MKVFTIGEIMMRLTPEGVKRFVQADRLDVSFGGAEANVAVALACWGADSVFITKLPSDDIGQAAVNSLRRYGVDVSHIIRGEGRTGVYYCEKGASQRPSKVIYDRAGSAFACADKSEFDFDALFAKGGMVHVTGITPALGEKAKQLTLKALESAKRAGCTVSYDVNYRSKLWSKQKAGEAAAEILPYVDVLIANENQVADVIGIKAPGIAPADDSYSPEANKYMAEELIKRYGFSTVAITARRTVSSEINTFRAVVAHGGETAFSREYKMFIADRVGAGDAFAAGVLYSLANGESAQKTADFAAAAAALAHSVEGDYALLTADEINALTKNGSAKVQR